MLKIFLVEDEFVIREGIKKNIDWNARGYELIGEAGDGELAFPMICKLKPDIVITDIRMPFMGGLELSRLIKKEMPWVEIIVLTGYGEFEYAKEAIKIGIAEYLLKPINSEELLKGLDMVAAKIEEKRREREIREKYLAEMEENFLKEKRTFLQHLITGAKTVSELLEMAEKLDIDIMALWYNVVLVKTQSMDHAYSEYSSSLVEIEQNLKKLDEEMDILVFDRNLEGRALVFKADSKEELEELEKDYLDRMKEILENFEKVRYFGGIGTPVNRLCELAASFESASHAFAHRYLVKGSLIVDINELKNGVFPAQEQFNIEEIDTKQIDRGKIQEFLKLANKEEVVYFVEEFFGDLGRAAMKSNIFRQYITMDVYFCVVDFLGGLQLQKEEIEKPDMSADIIQSEESTQRYAVRIISKALELRENAAGNRYGDVVDEVMRYIEQNYAQEDLSLNLVASHVNFSPNHLSTVFSQQTGQTFIKYLTDLRMNKAKELLRCTGKRSSEISMEVGYKDPHYFSYLFKKTQGMTPTRYREGKNAEEEE